jgi:hypothetical protein
MAPDRRGNRFVRGGMPQHILVLHQWRAATRCFSSAQGRSQKAVTLFGGDQQMLAIAKSLKNE